MTPYPVHQQNSVPYPICDADRIASLERQLASATSVPLNYHLHDMEEAEHRFQKAQAHYNDALAEAERRFQHERDRRNTEVTAERDLRYEQVGEANAKAITIKQVADEKALDLARQLDVLKDARSEETRDRVGKEQGFKMGAGAVIGYLVGAAGAIFAIIELVIHSGGS